MRASTFNSLETALRHDCTAALSGIAAREKNAEDREGDAEREGEKLTKSTVMKTQTYKCDDVPLR